MDFQYSKQFSLVHHLWVALLSTLLASCYDPIDGANSSPSGTNTLASGITVSGQHAVTGSTITVYAADGSLLTTAVSDSNAHYTITLPDQADYPYVITADAGVELVSGATPEFSMLSVVTGPDVEIANINAFTTLIVKTAEAMPGGLTLESLQLATQYILQLLNFGLDTTVVPDPITTPVTAENAASLIKANEVFTEMMRRLHSALQVIGYDLTVDNIIATMASDMADGYLDGNGSGSEAALVAATANIISGQVLIESLSNNLNVNGTWATDFLDNAITTALQEFAITSADATITAAMLEETKTAISAAQAIDPSEALSTLALLINSLSPGANPTDIETILPQTRAQDFRDAIILTASASKEQLASINASVHPTFQQSPDDTSVSLGWLSNPDQILGYIVYFGPSATSATTIASETSGTSVQYLTKSDLGLNAGDNVCFRLRAFNLAGLSEFSGAACMII